MRRKREQPVEARVEIGVDAVENCRKSFRSVIMSSPSENAAERCRARSARRHWPRSCRRRRDFGRRRAATSAADAARDTAGDDLRRGRRGRWPRGSLGAEDAADDGADAAEHAAAVPARAWRRCLPRLGRRRRCARRLRRASAESRRPIPDRRSASYLPLHRALGHHRLALLRRDRPDARRRRADHARARPSTACRCLRGTRPAPRPCRAR